MRLSLIRLLTVMAIAAAIGVIVMLNEGNSKWAIYCAWSGVALGVIILLMFHRYVARPLHTIIMGVDLLREQDFSSRLVKVGERETDRIVDMFNSMMATLKEERLRVREQNYFLDLLMEVSPMGILILDPKGCISVANKAAATYLDHAGADKLVGLKLGEIDGRLGEVIASLEAGQTVTSRLDDAMIFRCSRLSFMDRGYAHPFIIIEALTEEVMMAERRSYEKVIRVIAHEVNNSMGGICSMLDTITACADDDGRDPAETEALRECGMRCKGLSEFITAYADVVKLPAIEAVGTDLNSYLADRRVMLESLCGRYGASFRFEPGDDALPVRLDAVLMEQALINIVKNAAESAAAKGGEVVISTTARPATLTVADNGTGISSDVSARLFSPFFTTKPQGQGIGWLVVRDVLRQHNCRFSLRTDPDGWTRFTVRF